MEDDIDDLLSDYKLCGFMPVVLASSNSSSHLAPGTTCRPHSFSNSVNGFITRSGDTLIPISEENANESSSDPKPKKRRGKRSRIQMMSGSVVDQIRTLSGNHCLKVVGTIQRVSVRNKGEVRAVVVADVYLPVGVWCGWQFTKSSALAASFFKHVSCDWEMRTDMLSTLKDDGNSLNEDDQCIWYNTDCHVLGCSLHSKLSSEFDSAKKKLFDIHDIFKSLPTAQKEEKVHYTSIIPDNATHYTGIWDVNDDLLTAILAKLSLRSLSCVSSTCRHLRYLALPVMPCMKLKLFPHQQAAVDWMLKRERHPSVMPHPLYMSFSTSDGCDYYINSVSGKISTDVVPKINDFCGGMFCDEPGLGKTITALSLILKTHGMVADPPNGVKVTWCKHNHAQRCGYYELNADDITNLNPMLKWKRLFCRRGEYTLGKIASGLDLPRTSNSSSLKRPFDSIDNENEEVPYSSSEPLSQTGGLRSNGRAGHVRRNLLDDLQRSVVACNKKPRKKSNNTKRNKSKLPEISNADVTDSWVQCDSCRKWRRLCGKYIPDDTAAWFCSMNTDQLHQSCAVPEEIWDRKSMITYYPGFYSKESISGNNKNTMFFVSILKEHFTKLDRDNIKALEWLATLSNEKFEDMETKGLSLPVIGIYPDPGDEPHGYEIIFQAFGLVRQFKRGRVIWFYPPKLENLVFDSNALQIALTKSFHSSRFYLSRATLIVVPANLVEHWKTQIRKHIVPDLLSIFVWADNVKPSAHSLAWDYDIVITTFNRLSAEWGPRKLSVLTQIHWFRVILDEGHTLGSSVSMTNKLQMAISLVASRRWILTGTPTPNTPSSQLTHLQPMLKFLHDEVYGQDHESWDAGILKPFEAEIEEARSHLLHLLRRIMISARKKDLKNIPPCIKNVILLDFNEEHARSYNELVVTVRRNILMADWNDPSHVESLLNPKQWKFRSNTIRNIRLSCCVSGHIKVTEAGNDIQDTMDLLVQRGLNPLSEYYGLIRVSLLYGGNCMRCKYWCRLPVITPCKHLLCLDCVALDNERCTVSSCEKSYEMQLPETLTRPENPNPKWSVPKDLIELQPSYRQDDWDPDWQSTSSSKVSYLVQRLKSLQEANRKLDCREIVSNFDEFSTFDIRDCDFFVEGVCRQQNDISCMPDKVIIFSQFLEHIHVIEQQLKTAGIEYVGMYSPMHSGNKIKSLMTFQQDMNCMVLLMDGSAALGLDLSFTTHVFLMEPIWDRSVEEQVISRAHRMGATRPIYVETLAMRGTIEEQMIQFLEDSTECIKAFKQSAESEGTRIHRTLHDFAERNYLAKIGFVKTSNTIA